MRAGPLSDDAVIAILNAQYVPVFVSNEEYEGDGPAPTDERAQRNRIWREANEKKLDSGTVHVYLLDPQDGAVLDSMHVARAAQKKNLLPMLQRLAEKFSVPAGKPIVKPTAQSRPPEAHRNDLVLHLTSRGFNQGSWREFPGENWLVLGKNQWQSFVSPMDAKDGQAWNVEASVTSKLLTYFYPQTENNNVQTNRFEQQLLTAKVLYDQEGPKKDGIVRVRLDGRLRMKHAFYPGRKDDTPVDATVAGLVEYDRAAGHVKTFRVATVQATYGKEGFAVVVRRVDAPREIAP